jgi:hypothetical protein
MGDLLGENKKNCLPKMEGGKVHLLMIEKRRRSRGFAPVAIVLYYLIRDFG